VRVLVVGAGPAGLMAGITLAGYGIDVLVVERRNETSALSRAMLISTRSMELLRRWGLEEAVRARASDIEPYFWATESLACGVGIEIPMAFPAQAEAAAISPTRPAWAPQDDLEPILLDHLRTMPTAAVHFGCELTGLHQDHGDVQATLLDRGTGTSHVLNARYVIGADGPYSTVREQLGIAMEGQDHLGDYESVQFRASLEAVAGQRKPPIYIITRPDAAGQLSPRGRGDRWVYARERVSGRPGLADLQETELAELLSRVAGVDSLRPRIERFSDFALAAQIAERYRRGRVFLAGDAAHRMTPRGGTGMNTAIQDAFDLGWKLAWVLHGWAPIDLLDSYETERRPIGIHNVKFSAEPPGTPCTSADTLPWDLNGRLAHHWIPAADRISTIDLVGDGLTLFVGPAGDRWTDAKAMDTEPVPLTVRVLDHETAAALGLRPGGAMLVRPDSREIRRWSHYDEAAPPRVEHLAPTEAGAGRAR
jgi:putative polyketide hydroxylase